MGDNRNIIMAVFLSIAVLFVFEAFWGPDRSAPPAEQQTAQQASQQAGGDVLPGAPTGTPQAPGAAARPDMSAMGEIETRAKVLAETDRVRINTPKLHGSVSLKGGLIDDITLIDYRETTDPKSDEIVLLSPRGTENAYYASFGWVAEQGAQVALPGPDTVWQPDAEVLTPATPLTLSWDNGQGLTFKRTFAVDEKYMFTVTQSVVNANEAPVTLFPFSLVSRRGTPQVTGFYILHEGLLGVFEDGLMEVDYDDLIEEGQISEATTGGWIGITDKYWLAAIAPGADQQNRFRMLHTKDGTVDKYQVDSLSPALTVAGGSEGTTTDHVFIGAKEAKLLDAYAADLNIELFDRAIDFGWFWFLTKPIFYALIWFNGWVGNLGVAILLLTVAIKLAMFPLANKSYRAMSKMKKLQPKMKQLQERYGEDKVRLNQEMMALYKKEKANPASGCLPIIPQIFIFFALYKVLFVTIEMRQAPFFGWIEDLSAPDPTSIFNLFGLIAWTPPDFLMIGVWPLIMGGSMWLQQKLNPTPPDPIQQKIFTFLPIVFTFMLAQFPAGLVIYWAWNNILSIAQQWVIMRQEGVKVDLTE